MTKRDYYGQWMHHVIARSWHISDTIASIVSLLVPALARWVSPAWEANMGNLVWQVPIALLASLALVRIFLAPYWIAQEQEKKQEEKIQEINRLQQEITYLTHKQGQEIRKLQEALHLQLDDTIQKIAIGPKSQFSLPAKLALLQRKEYELWLELETAELEDKPLLIKRLEQILELQLDVSVQIFQIPSSNYQEQFNKVVLKLEKLRDLAKRIKL